MSSLIFRCDRCGRSTVSPETTDNMPQPNGQPCGGAFRLVLPVADRGDEIHRPARCPHGANAWFAPTVSVHADMVRDGETLHAAWCRYCAEGYTAMYLRAGYRITIWSVDPVTDSQEDAR